MQNEQDFIVIARGVGVVSETIRLLSKLVHGDKTRLVVVE